MLEDTSFAIHPGKKKTLENSAYHDIGDLIGVKQSDNHISFDCEHGQVKLVFYRTDVVRVVMNPFAEPSLESSPALVKRPDNIQTEWQDQGDVIIISSSDMAVHIQKAPFRLSVFNDEGKAIVQETTKGMGFKETKEVICFKEMNENDHFYGYGEKSGFLDKRGEKLSMWNTDVYAPHNPETIELYQSIPYFMTVRDGNAYGIFFDNTFRTTFDMKTEQDTYSFMAEGGQLDYYLMAGPTPKDVIEQYTDLTGRMPLPPKWAIGYHQSRYSYETEQEVRELANTFLEKQIPLDVIYLDIHYMDGYRVFTFDRDRFPTPDKMVEDLKKVGIRIVPIVDPGVKKDPEYQVYQSGIREDHFCKYIEGNIYYGEVWPGTSAFPDFTKTSSRSWWGENHRFYTDLGIEGIWNDMNEPAVFNETKTMDIEVMHDNDGKPRSHREMHNLYGFLMGMATYEGMKGNLNGKRPFLLTRAGYSGVQRYAAVWTGDNRSFWEHLQLSLPMCMNLGISGIAFSGPDVGGFAHDTTGELLARWTQVGAFTPYFRNHSAIGTVRQEPWAFGEKIEAIVKKYIELRYQWLPHLYSLFAEASKTGVPVMRPLLLEFPKDRHTVNLSDQFMIGSNVLIAPIMTPGTTYRAVYLPEGRWLNYWTDEVLEGGQHVIVQAELDILPIFIKQGSFLVTGAVKQSTEVADETLQVHIYPSSTGEAHFTFYDDDGKTFDYQQGHFIEMKVSCTFAEDRIDLTIHKQGEDFQRSWKQIEFIVHHPQLNSRLFVDGNELDLTNAESEKVQIAVYSL